MKLECSNCGFDKIVCDLHHIKGRKIPDCHNHKNLSYLCPNCHRQADLKIIPESDLISLYDQIGDRWKQYYYSFENGE
jgi:5-methylcytosine-specific restriction endonuclease McrA